MVYSCPDLLRLSICCQSVSLQSVQNGRDTPGVLIVPFQVMAWGCCHCVGKLDLGHSVCGPALQGKAGNTSKTSGERFLQTGGAVIAWVSANR